MIPYSDVQVGVIKETSSSWKETLLQVIPNKPLSRIFTSRQGETGLATTTEVRSCEVPPQKQLTFGAE